MKKLYILFLAIFATANIYAQTYTISFAATGAATTIDSVKVENLTHPATLIWHAGDVLQLILASGINDFNSNHEMLQIYPNPMQGQAVISFYAKKAGNTIIRIYDISGKELLQTENKLMVGSQEFELVGLKQGMYLITINGNSFFYTSKLISMNNKSIETKICFKGSENQLIALNTLKNTTSTLTMPYTTGDSLKFTSYTGNLTSVQKDVPTSSKTITFSYPTSLIATVLIPAGTFTMGSPGNEVGHLSNETQHQVTLSAFRMSKYEITNAQFAIFLNIKNIGSNGLYAAGTYPNDTLIVPTSGSNDWGLHYTGSQWVAATGFENCPVINVSWFGATEFATYASGSLPTESQWEYACRANTTTAFNTGICLSDAQANYDWAYPYSGCTNNITIYPYINQIVGSYPPNAFGLYDMHGNVLELCRDWYGVYPTTAQTNPTGASTGTARVARGGGISSYAKDCRSAIRYYGNPYSHSYFAGFRIVLAP